MTRRSKTLLQQAKYYEVHNEMEMMCLIWEAWVNGNYSDFKSYYRSLNMESRRRFIGFIYNQVDGYTFYRMVDMLMLTSPKTILTRKSKDFYKPKPQEL